MSRVTTNNLKIGPRGLSEKKTFFVFPPHGPNADFWAKNAVFWPEIHIFWKLSGEFIFGFPPF